MDSTPTAHTDLDGYRSPPNSDADEVRELITRWLTSIQRSDIDGVLAHHDPEIVLFDVGPPALGFRGIDEYRDSWPSFFEWLAQGASIELLELEVVAGPELAFAYGLLRAGTEADITANPDNRLRTTIGLRKIGGQWTVLHEHHSLCMT